MANEKRLIDANQLDDFRFHENGGEWRKIANAVIDGIQTYAPTIDAVEVVRCKDCKHYVLKALACRNEHMNGVIGIDGFCSYGERKDNGKID